MRVPVTPAKFALRFVLGEPSLLQEHINYFAPTGQGQFSVSDNGVLVYGSLVGSSRLVWLDRSGAEVGQLGDAAAYRSVRLSRDEKRALFTLVDPKLGTSDIWLSDLALGTDTRLTDDPRTENYPVWSPGGDALVFTADRGNAPFLHSRQVSDNPAVHPVVKPSDSLQRPLDWSPDADLGRDDTLMAVGIKPGPDLEVGVTERLFPLRYFRSRPMRWRRTDVAS